MPKVYVEVKPNLDIKGGLIDGLQLLTRQMADPSVTFVSGEWVKETADGIVGKLSSGSAAAVDTAIRPRIIWGGTERHDVQESGSLTCLRGLTSILTLKYETGESFAIGDKVSLYWDGTYGTLRKTPGSTGTYTVVGTVTSVPTVDGTDYLGVEIFGDAQTLIIA